jgi:D-sedoheptulose 7-phosphate isomerase
MEKIKNILNSSIKLKEILLRDEKLLETVKSLSDEMTNALKNKNRVFFCGNGGSAADAQHLAAELAGKFYFDRPPLPAEALHVNTSYMTAVANDYSYDEVYSRLIKAQATSGDVLVGISTSGNSANVVKAINTANEMGLVTAGFTGKEVGKLNDICKYVINIPSSDTPRIQEAHILIGHIICERIERALFGNEN